MVNQPKFLKNKNGEIKQNFKQKTNLFKTIS